jgi:hypothetical protein
VLQFPIVESNQPYFVHILLWGFGLTFVLLGWTAFCLKKSIVRKQQQSTARTGTDNNVHGQ